MGPLALGYLVTGLVAAAVSYPLAVIAVWTWRARRRSLRLIRGRKKEAPQPFELPGRDAPPPAPAEALARYARAPQEFERAERVRLLVDGGEAFPEMLAAIEGGAADGGPGDVHDPRGRHRHALPRRAARRRRARRARPAALRLHRLARAARPLRAAADPGRSRRRGVPPAGDHAPELGGEPARPPEKSRGGRAGRVHRRAEHRRRVQCAAGIAADGAIRTFGSTARAPAERIEELFEYGWQLAAPYGETGPAARQLASGVRRRLGRPLGPGASRRGLEISGRALGARRRRRADHRQPGIPPPPGHPARVSARHPERAALHPDRERLFHPRPRRPPRAGPRRGAAACSSPSSSRATAT